MDSSAKQLRAYSLAMMLLSLPSLAQGQTSATLPNSTGGETGQAAHEGASGDDAIYCRPPQQRTDSVMMGPKVCLTVRKWKELRDRGQDVSSDGQSIVQARGDESVFSGRP